MRAALRAIAAPRLRAAASRASCAGIPLNILLEACCTRAGAALVPHSMEPRMCHARQKWLHCAAHTSGHGASYV